MKLIFAILIISVLTLLGCGVYWLWNTELSTLSKIFVTALGLLVISVVALDLNDFEDRDYHDDY